MSDEIFLVKQAAIGNNGQTKLPNSSQVVVSLLAIEKSKKKEQHCSSLEELLGSWNLRLITGTKKTRKKAGVILGAGKYIPPLIKIKITYKAEQPTSNIGQVINSVKFAFIQLSLTGPIKLIPDKNILAFDFTYLTFSLWGLDIYQGYLKNGLQREENFQKQELKEQAFFKYFLIEDNFIAARGRGGGLALWGKEK